MNDLLKKFIQSKLINYQEYNIFDARALRKINKSTYFSQWFVLCGLSFAPLCWSSALENAYAIPMGMMKLRSSAYSPHATRFVWNMTIHTPSPIAQHNAPIADNITSGTKRNITHWTITRASKWHCGLLTNFDWFLFGIGWLPERFIEKPKCIDGPHKRQQSKTSWNWRIANINEYGLCIDESSCQCKNHRAIYLWNTICTNTTFFHSWRVINPYFSLQNKRFGI